MHSPADFAGDKNVFENLLFGPPPFPHRLEPHTRDSASPSCLPPKKVCLTQKPNARARLRQPTTRYATPRKGFLPPAQDRVVSTRAFVPEKGATGKADHTLKVMVVPLGMRASKRP